MKSDKDGDNEDGVQADGDGGCGWSDEGNSQGGGWGDHIGPRGMHGDGPA